MKFVKFLLFSVIFIPCISFGASSNDFQNAAKLLAAARRGDIQTVQVLINSGVDVNYVDSTGVSLVCTAVMNNDTRAIQILQMYGADASNCDRQIKDYKRKSRVAASGEEYGFFSGLSSSHVLALSAIGVAVVLGGVALLTDAFDNDDNNASSSSGGSHGGGGGGGGSSSSTTPLFALNLPYGPGCTGSDCSEFFSFWQSQQDFEYMSDNGFNYLMVSRAYNPFVRGYLGMSTVRNDTTKEIFDLSYYPFNETPDGGKPINVAMLTSTGVNLAGSAVDGIIQWFDESNKNVLASLCQSSDGTFTPACQAAVDASVKTSHKYYNLSGGVGETPEEDTSFDLTGSGSVFGGASDEDTKLAKIIAGWEYGGRDESDYYGFIPNGQLLVYKIGVGESEFSDYKNYYAINNALTLKNNGNYVSNVVANLSLPAASVGLDYVTVAGAKSLYDAASGLNKISFYFGDAGFNNGLINLYYNLNTNDDSNSRPGDDAKDAFTDLKNNQSHILVNSAGRNKYGLETGASLDAQVATFENFVPVIYPDLENLFMTVVALSPTDGTSDDSITGYTHSGAGKLQLSHWSDASDNTITYSSRMCGLTGTGNGGELNPWCFAAPGATDMEATAAMAGAVALVKSAFSYMSSKQAFLLLALTADGAYLGINPETGLAWTSSTDNPNSELISYLQGMYILPGSLDGSDEQYLTSFKNAFGYGMINLERATRPNTNVYFYDSNANKIITSSGNAYWCDSDSRVCATRASTALSLTGRGAITTSFYDVLESADGTVSLPRVWQSTFASDSSARHGLYMGDILNEFDIGSNYKSSEKIGNFEFSMSMSPRAYSDNLNGLDDLRVGFSDADFDVDIAYQHHLTDGESRFNGRANGLLALAANALSTGSTYKSGNFAFGARAFSGVITDESLLENDPVVSSQYEPGRLGFVNGFAVDTKYSSDKFGLMLSAGVMNESDTVLGMSSGGMLYMSGGKTRYMDAIATYKPSERVKLFARGTFANTRADEIGGLITNLSDLKSNAFAIGADIGGFGLTVSAPLAVVDGRMGYGYAEFEVVENNGSYDIAMNNAHTEYVDLSAVRREYRFSASYRTAFNENTTGGTEFIYRLNPGNTNAFGNESILMFKMHRVLGL